MRWVAILIFFLVTPLDALAGDQREREAVLAVIDALFAALGSKDTAAFAELVLEEGMTFTQAHLPDGTVKLGARSNRQHLEALVTSRDRMEERYRNPTVLIHESIAVVWTPYEFRLNGELSHCGVDVFELLKVNGAWKIGNAMWTAEPAGCRAQ